MIDQEVWKAFDGYFRERFGKSWEELKGRRVHIRLEGNAKLTGEFLGACQARDARDPNHDGPHALVSVDGVPALYYMHPSWLEFPPDSE